MRQVVQSAAQVDVQGLAVIFESFLRRLVVSEDHIDVITAAGVALEKIEALREEYGASNGQV